MKLRTILSSLLGVAFVVGLFSFYGGYLLRNSEAADIFADMVDGYADAFAPLLGLENVQGLRNTATDMRNTARQSHDYGIYCIVGAVLITVVEAAWIVWKFGKAEQESAIAPTPSTAPSSEIPAMK